MKSVMGTKIVLELQLAVIKSTFKYIVRLEQYIVRIQWAILSKLTMLGRWNETFKCADVIKEWQMKIQVRTN